MTIFRATRSAAAMLLFVLVFGLITPGCSTIRQIANLRSIDFGIENVTGAQLAGVDLRGVRDYGDLGAREAVLIGRALSGGELPLRFQLNLMAQNPEENNVTARMVQMDWTLLIENRETVSGVINENFVLPPGQVRGIPITVELDLLRFFDQNAQDIVDLVLSFAGAGGEPANIQLRATPVIETPIGPIRYPEPITIVSRDIG